MPPVAGSVVADHPAAGVACVVCGVGGGGGGHYFYGVGFEERGDAGGSGDAVEELDELGGGGNPSAVGVHSGDVELVGFFGVLAVVDDFVVGAVALFVAGDLHGGDAAGAEDVGADPGVVGFGGDLLDDAAEEAVAKVGVGPMGAGRAGEGEVGEGPVDELGLVPGGIAEHGVGGVVGPAAGGVGEEVVDGDVGDEGLVGELAIFCAEDAGGAEDFVVEVELALLDEGEDGDGGNRLGDGGDAKEGVLPGLREVCRVGDACCLVVDELAVAGDGDGGGGDGELLAEVGGDAGHFGALLGGGGGGLGLGQGFERGADGGRGGGDGKIAQEGSAA